MRCRLICNRIDNSGSIVRSKDGGNNDFTRTTQSCCYHVGCRSTTKRLAANEIAVSVAPVDQTGVRVHINAKRRVQSICGNTRLAASISQVRLANAIDTEVTVIGPIDFSIGGIDFKGPRSRLTSNQGLQAVGSGEVKTEYLPREWCAFVRRNVDFPIAVIDRDVANRTGKIADDRSGCVRIHVNFKNRIVCP